MRLIRVEDCSLNIEVNIIYNYYLLEFYIYYIFILFYITCVSHMHFH
jgi:Fe2+ transport system protein B